MTVTSVFTTLRIADGTPLFLTQHLHRLCDDARAFGIPIPDRLTPPAAPDGLLRITLSHVGVTFSHRPLTPLPPTATLYSGERPYPAHKTSLTALSQTARSCATATHHGEALLVDSTGALREGAWTNAFFVFQDGRIQTHPLPQVLPGITREYILSLFPAIIETPTYTTDAFTEVFLTGTGIGVLPLTHLDSRPLTTALGTTIHHAYEAHLLRTRPR